MSYDPTQGGANPYSSPQAGSAGPPQGPVKNYLVEAILVTVCCCLPFGIAAIVFAAQVDGKLKAGDYAGAVESAAKAKQFVTWGVIGGVILGGLYAVFMALGVVAQA